MLVLAGPTAVGKTDLSIKLAQYFGTEILSADSRQIYRQLNIGVAKPSKDYLNLVKHHFIDHCNVTDAFSAGEYEREAISLMTDRFQKHRLLIMTGGTGLYIQAVLNGLDDFPEVSREKWSELYAAHGIIFLQDNLKTMDPVYYESVDLSNPHRLIRALSVTDAAGKPYSEMRKHAKSKRSFDAIQIALTRPREQLYERIDLRVDRMMQAGLLDEVRSLLSYRQLQSLQSVGYKELFKHIDGEWTLEEAVNKIKQHSRNYAKRQMTWFRNQGDWSFIHPENAENKILEIVAQTL